MVRPEFLKARYASALLIADEVTGFGRTGALFLPAGWDSA